MRAFFIFILFILAGFTSVSQSIQILNEETSQPVKGVYIYDLDGTTTVQSDEMGFFSLSLFSETAIITFQHPSFQPLTLTYEDLLSQNVVFLKELIIQMNELVVSANKWEQSTGDIPNTIAIIKPQDIEFQNPQTAADILDQSGKVFIQKSQAGGGSPMIRGFSANSVLIVVDGVRMNNAIFRSGNLQNVVSIDPNVLQNTEVIFGPGSVIYGSDALGGVMDFHTISPDFSDKKKSVVTVMSRYSSANNEKTGHVNLVHDGPKLAFVGGFSYSSFSDLRSGKNHKKGYEDFGLREFYQSRENDTDIAIINNDPYLQVNTAYNQWNGIAKLKLKISDDKNLTYGFYLSNTSDIDRYDRLIRTRSGLPRSAEWYYGPQKWIRNSLQFNDFQKKSWSDAMKITLAQQSFTESRNTRDFNDSERITRTERVDVYSLNFDMDKTVSAKSDLYYGLEVILNDVNSDAITFDIENGTKSNASTRYPDGGSNYQTSAIYLNYVSKRSDKLIFNAGGRLNQVNLKSKFADKTFFNFPFDDLSISKIALNGNAGVVFKPSSDWKFDLLLSSGFRAPNVDDAGKLFDSEPGNVIVPNPNLDPEKAYNIDLGVSWILKDLIKIDLTGFYTIVDDIITRRNSTFNGEDSIVYDNVLSRVQSLQNVSGGFIYGASIYMKAQLSDKLTLTSTYTYTDGEDSDGFPVRHAAPTFGRTSLKYEIKSWTFDFYSNYNGTLPFDKLAPSEQNKDYLYTEDGALSWVTLNMKFGVHLSDKIRIFGGIENLTDLHYRPYSSGISAPGRNYIMSIKAQF